jgi:hypothetical protein
MSILNVGEVQTNFIKSTTGTTSLNIDSTGRVLIPNQPSFAATGPSDYTTYNNGTEITKFTSTLFNVGNHYNTTTCRFTAPIAGIYHFTATCLTELDQAGGISFCVNGIDALNGGIIYMSAERGRSNSIILSLSTNDYVSLFARFSDMRIYGQPFGGFSGYLVG